MKIGEKQELFASLIPELIDHAIALGFTVRLQELRRSKTQALYNSSHCRVCKKHVSACRVDRSHEFRAIGIANSLHCDGLALDLILFRDGEPQWTSEPYTELGEFWESLHELCSNGRDFQDGGHFSIMHGGRR